MRITWIIGLSIFIGACNINGSDKEVDAFYTIDTLLPKELAGSFSDQQSLKLDSLSILHFLESHEHFIEFENDIFRFYRNRNYALAWFDSTGMIEQANLLYNRIMKMKEDGMTLDVPYLDEYAAIMHVSENPNQVYTELMQTAEYLHFAKKLISGISENETKALEWYIPKKKTDYISLLQKLLSGDSSIVNQNLFPQYHLLKKELARFREIEQQGGWDSIVFHRKLLRAGEKDEAVKGIKKRLFATGELTILDTTNYFNVELVEAVKKFQLSHGIHSDGIIGKTTVIEMNTPVTERIQQIMVNMERCRWLPNQTQNTYLIVNIPQFKLYVYEGDSMVLSCNAVVGKETNRTAIFKGDMRYIIFSAYWNVPSNILRKEVLPEIKKNRLYLEENHMEWKGNTLRQLPGPWNALGGVKFVFPNGYDIYLHDTPSKYLFNQPNRAFSHGCIRISEPKGLAMYLLADRPEWTSEAIDSAMTSGIEKFVTLEKPVPVYVVYFTAYVDHNGVLNFRKDVYGRDLQLKKMILN